MTGQPAANLASREVITQEIAAHLAEVVKSGLAGVGTTAAEALGQPLDMGRVKKKPGRDVDYLPEHDVVRTANRIFGFGRWGYEVTDLACLGTTPVRKDGKGGVHVGYRCTVRLTVAGCVPVSGVGYGDATEYQQSGPITAHELAVKEAESDAKKRAFKNFGDQFGLILYAKSDDRRRIEAENAPPSLRVVAEADRATDAQVEAVLAVAGIVSEDHRETAVAAVEAHRGKNEGGFASAAWLKKLGERLVEIRDAAKASDSSGSAERLEAAGFDPPAGATGETTPAAVEGAFRDAA